MAILDRKIVMRHRHIGGFVIMSIHASFVSVGRAFECGGWVRLHPNTNPRIVAPSVGHTNLFARSYKSPALSRLYSNKRSAGNVDSDNLASIAGSNSPGGEGRIPRALREDEWQAAQPFITPELKAKFTLSDGSVDYKGMSKLIPLQVDTGPLDVVYEDDDLIAVHATLGYKHSTDGVSLGCMQVSKPSGMLMNPPHRYCCSNRKTQRNNPPTGMRLTIEKITFVKQTTL